MASASRSKPSGRSRSAIHSKSRRTSVPPASKTTASSASVFISGASASVFVSGASARAVAGGSAMSDSGRQIEAQRAALSAPRNLQEPPDRPGIEPVLGLVHARLETLQAVVLPHFDRRLREHGTAVERTVHQMHGAPGDLHAVLEGLRDRVESRKSGQQRGMDVEDAILICS